MPTETVADPQATVKDAIKRLGSLATLPEVTAQIISTVEDPRSSAGKLHRIISHDPALVSRILKVVNSAFYGLPGQIGSVERAIVLLGMNAVKNIAVAASLGQLFRGVKLCNGFTAKDLWTHCIAVGVTARELARILKLPVADEAFLAGMIHDIGILVELQTWPEQLRAICTAVTSGGGNFCEIERRTLGVDHQMVGKALAEHWKFPMTCQQVAGFHHNPAALGDETAMLVTLVYVADTLCCKAALGFNLTAITQELDMAALAQIGLDAPVIEKVASNLATTVANANGLFG
jgi:HD-like signal output (HDOD) protein